ncbi:MAG: polyprenyl synthetase family protein [Treponema sp.]|nr:polyprenyl synthetase family protein [Treponema sp.]
MDDVFKNILWDIEAALTEALPDKTNENWQKDSFSELSRCVNDSHLKNLISPCRNLVDLGGKRWRPLLLVLCYRMAKEAGCTPVIPEEKIFSLTPLVEFVHTASLIHDDIEDSADTRRGKPACHIQYGLDVALNAGSWLYFQAAACLEKIDLPTDIKAYFYKLYTLLLRRLHLGQAMDILWHANTELFPTPSEYTQMVHLKTGTLSSLAVQLGLIAGGASFEEAAEAGKTAEYLGEGFQILDDVTNLTTGNPGKKRGDDIVEGKKSLPILMHVIERPKDSVKISYYFEKGNMEGPGSTAIEKCIELLNTSSSIQKAKEKGEKCIRDNISKLITFKNLSEENESARLIKKLFIDMLEGGK